MSDAEHSLNEPEDTDLDEAFAQLRRLEPSMSARLANRAAVAAELRAIDAAAMVRERAWWRRSISVPMPVATCMLAVLAITMPMSAVAWLEHRQADAPPASVSAEVSQNGGASDDSRSVNRRQSTGTSGFSVTETYLCGVGRISSHSRYSQTENSP
jgi:hypothetical protein